MDLVPSHGPLILGPIPGNRYEISGNVFGRDSHGFVVDGHRSQFQVESSRALSLTGIYTRVTLVQISQN